MRLTWTASFLLCAACATPAGPRGELPDHAAPASALERLDFLTGRWIAVNPNGTVNEEVWTPPRGRASIGTFRQVRLDGDCAFVEVSQIALEDGEPVLRLRHLHGRLEVPPTRADVSEFRLVELGDARVEFAGTGDAAEVASVVYERTGPETLVQRIGFADGSAESSFVTTYALDAP